MTGRTPHPAGLCQVLLQLQAWVSTKWSPINSFSHSLISIFHQYSVSKIHFFLSDNPSGLHSQTPTGAAAGLGSAPELHVLHGTYTANKSQDLLHQPGLERASTWFPDQRTTCAALALLLKPASLTPSNTGPARSFYSDTEIQILNKQTNCSLFDRGRV